MVNEKYSESAPQEPLSIPLEGLLGWFNEQASGTNAESAKLVSFLDRFPDQAETPPLLAKLGHIAGAKDMLQGLAAYLSVQAPGAEAQLTQFIEEPRLENT